MDRRRLPRGEVRTERNSLPAGATIEAANVAELINLESKAGPMAVGRWCDSAVHPRSFDRSWR